ncbi:MAG: hypothetical protein HBSAPP03_00720 [Phycisphaerae bacterium]|nr:MAG: hypothetical protein HBSAPP03_00720 [Phycisphaerae bacterium]
MTRGVLIVALAAVLAGCCGPRGGNGAPPRLDPPPAYAELAARYNERCADLDRLKAAVSLVITSRDERGGKRTDQVEANLQIIQPRLVSLRIDKVGQTLAILGSNESRYWWIDLAETPTARVGLHERATPAAAEAFGVPVHPLDLIDVLGVRSLPAEGASVARATDGTVGVTLPPRGAGWGHTRVYVDEATAQPSRVEIADAAGRVVIRAALSRYEGVRVAGNTFSPAKVATRVTIEVPDAGVEVVVGVSAPENPGKDMRTKPFELETLLRAYGVDQVIEVDAGVTP